MPNQRRTALMARRSSRNLVMAAADDGVSAVEFALVLPMLMFMLLGIAQFGLVIYLKAQIGHVARDVSRMLAVQAMAVDAAPDHVSNALPGWAGSNHTTDVAEITGADPDVHAYRVTITVPLEELTFFPMFGDIFAGKSLSVSTTMLREDL
jgi:hypothetical protein